MIEMKTKTQEVYTISKDECQLEENGKTKLSSDKDSEYEPYDYGSVKHPINYNGAVVHLVRCTIGTGLLLLPYSFQLVGYGVGILGSILITLLYVNNIHSLLFTEYELCKLLKIRNLTFIGVVEKSFEFGPKITQKFGAFFKGLQYVYYGIPSGCSVYLIIIADNSREILKQLLGLHFTLPQCLFLIILPILLLSLIPKLKFLIPLSIVTNVLSVLNMVIILLYSLNIKAWPQNGRLIGDIENIPKFFAIVLQSLIATGMILPLKNDMAKPKQFASVLGVLNVSFTILTFLFGTFGVVGYLNYGEDVNENVLSNLPAGEFITISIYIMYTLSLAVTYTLLFYVYYDTMWTSFLQNRLEKSKFEELCKYGLRLLINFSAFFMATLVPNFSLFTSIIGTIGIIIEIGLPSMLQLLLLKSIKVKPSVFRYCVLKNSIIISIAIIMFFMSSRTCISEIIQLYELDSVQLESKRL